MKVYIQDGRLVFYCPGCEHKHSVPINGLNDETIQWEWNGDVKYPTIKPSIRNNLPDDQTVCHLHVTNGYISYAFDCLHKLANQIVPMTEITR